MGAFPSDLALQFRCVMLGLYVCAATKNKDRLFDSYSKNGVCFEGSLTVHQAVTAGVCSESQNSFWRVLWAGAQGPAMRYMDADHGEC